MPAELRWGYHRAGFEVVGVDINPQKNYPFEFHQADAMTYPLEGFDAIHASPPCQAYSTATRDASLHPDLYEPTMERLRGGCTPYVVENVIGAPYGHGTVLCGSMCGLEVDGEWLRRHRNFETSWMMFQPPCAHPSAPRPINVTGNSFTREIRQYKHSRQAPFAFAAELMGIDWMTRDELGQAIPPAYTEWIGKQLIAAL